LFPLFEILAAPSFPLALPLRVLRPSFLWAFFPFGRSVFYACGRPFLSDAPFSPIKLPCSDAAFSPCPGSFFFSVVAGVFPFLLICFFFFS